MDDIIDISGQDSVMMTSRLAKEEGILIGISSGASLAAIHKTQDKYNGKKITPSLDYN